MKIEKLKNLLIYMLVLLVLTSCEERVDFKPEVAIKKAFEPTIELKNEQPDEIHVIIDVTASMKGFTFDKNFNNFLIRLNSAFSNANKYYYALNEKLTLIAEGNQTEKFVFFLDKKNYNSSKTDLTLLKKKLKPNSLVIFLNDMEYNSLEQYVSNISQYQSLLNQNYLVNQYCKSLDFNGNVYYLKDNRHRGIRYIGKRPFYAFLMTQNLNYSNYLDKIFFNNLEFDNSFSLMKNLTGNISIPDSGLISDNFTNYGKYEDEASIVHNDIYNLPLYNTGKLSCEIVIDNNLFSNWENIEAKNIVAEFYEFKNDSTLKDKKSSIEFDIENVVLHGNNMKFQLISKEEIYSNGVIQIKVQPKILPGWLDACNRSENDPENKIKTGTVNLKDFFINILNLNVNDFTISTVYINIGKD